MKHHEVVAAIIQKEGAILCLQRGPSKYDYIAYQYEFPGGKVEPGETREAALIREIQEELALTIEVQEHYLTVDHTYPDFCITLHAFFCQAIEAQPTLHEHVAYHWLPIEQLATLNWAAADLPFVAQLVTR
jgi:8-oxo-dGTP diphosphatase